MGALMSNILSKLVFVVLMINFYLTFVLFTFIFFLKRLKNTVTNMRRKVSIVIPINIAIQKAIIFKVALNFSFSFSQ